jgi:hypothetical protein
MAVVMLQAAAGATTLRILYWNNCQKQQRPSAKAKMHGGLVTAAASL